MIELKETTLDGVFTGGTRALPEGPQEIRFCPVVAKATAGEKVSSIPTLGVVCGSVTTTWRALSKSVLIRKNGEIASLAQKSNWTLAMKEALAPLVGKPLSEVCKVLNENKDLTNVTITHKEVVGIYAGIPYPRTLNVVSLRK